MVAVCGSIRRPADNVNMERWLDGDLNDLYHRAAEVANVHSGCQGKLSGEPGVRCGVLEQSGGLVWFEANRNPYLACC
jgi:hypothetical protein